MEGKAGEMIEHISPSVIIRGQTYYPPGWVWVVAFAIHGCQWAIDEVESGRIEKARNLYYGLLWAGEGI